MNKYFENVQSLFQAVKGFAKGLGGLHANAHTSS